MHAGILVSHVVLEKYTFTKLHVICIVDQCIPLSCVVSFHKKWYIFVLLLLQEVTEFPVKNVDEGPQQQLSGSDMPLATHTPPVEEDFGGYDYDYIVPPPHNLVCVICHYPACDPVQTNNCCGCTFCRRCITKYQRVDIIDNTRCPYCNQENFSYTNDKRAEHEIGDLMVFCSHKSLGCLWTGKLKSIKEHFNCNVSFFTAGCQYTIVQCGNKCGAEMQRRLLDDHLKLECELRQVTCQYCNTEGVYRWISGSHQRGCPKYPIECPNHCEVGYVAREEISVHLEQCPLSVVKCPFAIVGCSSVIRRKDVMEHLKTTTRLHVDCMLTKITSLNTEMHATQVLLEQTVNKLRGTVDSVRLTYRSQLDNFNQNLLVTSKEISKVKSTLTNHNSQMNSLFDEVRSKQDTTGSKIDSYSSELDSMKQDIVRKKHQLDLEVQSVQHSTLEQIQGIKQTVTDMEAMHITDLFDIKQELTEFKSKANQNLAVVKQSLNNTFVEQKAKVDDFQKSFEEFKRDFQSYKDALQTIKDNDVHTHEHQSETNIQNLQKKVSQQATEVHQYSDNIEVFVQLQGWQVQLNYRLSVSGNILPNIFLKMMEFTKYRNAKQVWNSPSFYTGDNGYKMCLSVSSHHIPSYVSICVLLMCGEYDDHLHWPLRGTLTLQLLNQLDNDNHTPPLHIEFDGSDESSNCQRVLAGERTVNENYGKFILFKNLAEDVRKRQYYRKDDALIFKILAFNVQHA